MSDQSPCSIPRIDGKAGRCTYPNLREEGCWNCMVYNGVHEPPLLKISVENEADKINNNYFIAYN